MGELVLPQVVSELVSRNRVTADDVLRLRREVYRDGIASRAEAEALFAIDRVCGECAPQWDEFFVEVVTDFLVNSEQPKGYISDANAQWLIRAISQDGVVDTRTEIELLVKVLEKAKSSPASLSAFALQQVAHVVVHGSGALAKGRVAQPGVVTKTDVDLMRRVLYAYGGDGHVGITRDEAEVLFDINDATVEAQNDPAWSDLFTKAVGFSLLASFGYAPPSKDDALARDVWLNDTDVNVGGFFSRMFAGGLKGYRDALATPTGVEVAFAEKNARREAANASAEMVTEDEAQWLIQRIGRDGVLHDNERQLLRFIADEASTIHPALKPLLDKVA
ncbi:MAG: hypothetical protein AAFR13_03010 [Pseudomonadota bacterium]